MADDLTPREAADADWPASPDAAPPPAEPPPPPESPAIAGMTPSGPWDVQAGPVAPPSGRRRLVVGVMALLVIVAMAVRLWPAASGTSPDPVAAADPGTVTIVAGTPASIDPARHGDLGSASFVSQLYETLTAVDPSLTVRPALAESWAVTTTVAR